MIFWRFCLLCFAFWLHCQNTQMNILVNISQQIGGISNVIAHIFWIQITISNSVSLNNTSWVWSKPVENKNKIKHIPLIHLISDCGIPDASHRKSTLSSSVAFWISGATVESGAALIFKLIETPFNH